MNSTSSLTGGGLVLAALALGSSAVADEGPGQDDAADSGYLLPHPADARWWLSGQLNVISQYHPAFHAAYSGSNSLVAHAEDATSFVATAYSGYRLSDATEALFDVESAGGNGLSTALGLGGFSDLDVVRNPSLGPSPNISQIHQIIPLGDERIAVERGPLRTFSQLPVRRIELRAGKLSTVDLFDVNSIGSDSHTQFMNWAIDNNGAYDYAADTRGYTLGAVAEYHDRAWAVRAGEMLMPTVANGIDYDWDVAHARGENLELELSPTLWPGRAGVIRVLGFFNHARMGRYAEAIAAFRSGLDAIPDITAHRAEGRTKPGVGLNLEQEVSDSLRAFGRAGWSDGAVESFAYTEVDNTVELGADLRGSAWRRAADRVGLAIATNGLAIEHRTYLALGGKGFLLGDGKLRYGREAVVEGYYTARAWRGIFPAVDLQFIQNPGYNRDRGPAMIGSVRLHVEL